LAIEVYQRSKRLFNSFIKNIGAREATMLAKVFTFTIVGIDAYPVEVEVDISPGMPQFNIVGLPDNVVKESKERIRSAIRNSGYDFPMERITVNLAPAQLKKEGAGFDLPIAIGILTAAEVIPPPPMNSLFVAGELSLDGYVKPIYGALSMAVRAAQDKVQAIMVPEGNASESALVDDHLAVYPVKHLRDAVMFLVGKRDIAPHRVDKAKVFDHTLMTYLDFSDVRGQHHAKRGLEIAAAGGHNVLMVGPPGAGKTMLAQRLPGILPPLTFEEALETTRIYSVAGLLGDSPMVVTRPYRSPHHSISYAGLIGGGSVPKPGEVSLAHNGVLFLDEFPEFSRNVLELLRQPMEDGKVTIARATTTITYPARFMLVAAMNPCPCGYFGYSHKACTCSANQVAKYRSRISGPIIDRIDIHIDVPAVEYDDLVDGRGAEESSESIRERVIRAREIQLRRLKGTGIFCNAALTASHIDAFCNLSPSSKKLMKEALKQLGLSARAYHRILKVARTIADLEGKDEIQDHHLFEAIQYRSMDRKIPSV
jgi:magnesium chelatase family protein